MGKHLLFFIHGIGIHEPSWGEELNGPIETLKKVSQQYAYFQQAGQDRFANVECISVHYDEVFRDTIAKWQSDASSITAFDPTGVFKDGLGWLATASDKDFWWSHLADLAMYRCFPLYRQAVRISVIKQLADAIERAYKADESAYCSVVAHSMGTAVAHDCLHLLGTTHWADGPYANVLAPSHWRFQNIFMVANTSRLLQTQDAEMKPAYDSIVKPGPLEDPKSYCFAYWNFRHEADPVPFPRRFEPIGWTNYENDVVRHFYEYNVHDLSHYLLHPRVHIPILNKVVAHLAVSDQEKIKAVDAFPQFGGDVAFIQKAKDMAAQLHTLTGEMADDLSSLDWIKKLLKFHQIMETAR